MDVGMYETVAIYTSPRRLGADGSPGVNVHIYPTLQGVNFLIRKNPTELWSRLVSQQCAVDTGGFELAAIERIL